MVSVPIYFANDPDRLTDPTYHNSETEGFYRENEGRTRFLAPLINPSRKYDDRGFALLALLMLVAILVLLYLGASSGFFSKNPFSQSKRSQQPMTEKTLITRIREVVESGGNIDASQNQYKQTYLHIAAKDGFAEAVVLCLNNGANIEAVDYPARMTPLHRAAFDDCAAVVKLLIDRGADVEAREMLERTVLGSAINAEANREDMIAMLLAAGADVNCRDKHGETPLFWAIREGQVDTVKVFLANGADITTRNIIGSTPLDIAGGEVASLLRSHGAKRGSEL